MRKFAAALLLAACTIALAVLPADARCRRHARSSSVTVTQRTRIIVRGNVMTGAPAPAPEAIAAPVKK